MTTVAVFRLPIPRIARQVIDESEVHREAKHRDEEMYAVGDQSEVPKLKPVKL
jgi:hypothetical protein